MANSWPYCLHRKLKKNGIVNKHSIYIDRERDSRCISGKYYMYDKNKMLFLVTVLFLHKALYVMLFLGNVDNIFQ